MERQRLVINQVFRKLAQPATLAQLPALLRIAGEDINTDLSPLELTQLISVMANTKLSTGRLAGREYWENELSYWMPSSNTLHPSGHGDVPPN
jgi:anionic cell wall polymer biosynthesis LytR-Cps2A-Psr (LCP) family protein